MGGRESADRKGRAVVTCIAGVLVARELHNKNNKKEKILYTERILKTI